MQCSSLVHPKVMKKLRMEVQQAGRDGLSRWRKISTTFSHNDKHNTCGCSMSGMLCCVSTVFVFYNVAPPSQVQHKAKSKSRVHVKGHIKLLCFAFIWQHFCFIFFWFYFEDDLFVNHCFWQRNLIFGLKYFEKYQLSNRCQSLHDCKTEACKLRHLSISMQAHWLKPCCNQKKRNGWDQFVCLCDQ